MIEFGLPFLDYLQREAVHWSTLKDMDQSPRHYLHASAREWDARHLRVGRAAHAAILEPGLYESTYAIFDGRRAGKEWEEFRDLNELAGNSIITRTEANEAEAIRDAFLFHPPAKVLLDHSTARELSITWTDAETGLACKARPDLITDDTLVDIKTSKDSSPRQFWRTASRLYYHSQLAWYLDALEHYDKRPRRCVIVAIESVQPHDVVVYQVPGELISIGRRHYRGLLNRVAECHRTNSWPGCAPGEVELQYPDWALETGIDEHVDITFGGESIAI